jgi:putative peptidoglycan lipid II flippase
LPRIVAAALAMGGLLWLAARAVPALSVNAHGFVQAALLTVLISGAIAVYGLCLVLFGVVKWGDAVYAVRQTAASDLRD